MNSFDKKKLVWVSLIGFLLLSVLIRFFTYFPSVINHDESTYIVIAQQLLQGDVYLINVVDTKPPGIFILFAFIFLLFGKSILTIRLAASVAIGLTAFFIYLIHRKLNSKEEVARASGVIYILLISCFTFYGLSPNTEHFFVLFTAIALWGLIRNKWVLDPLFAGLAIGFGFLIKQMAAFDMLALGLLTVFFFLQKEKTFWQRCVRAGLYSVGALTPFFIVVFYYLSIDQCEKFCEYTFFVAGRYLISPPLMDYVSFYGDFFLRFLPVTCWFIIGLFWHRIKPSWWRKWIMIWSGLILIALGLTGKMFAHYWLQFMLPIALVGGHMFDRSTKRHKTWEWLLRWKTGGVLLGIFFCVTMYVQKKDFMDKPDAPKEIAYYLRSKLGKETQIFTGDAHQIIYALLDKKSLTPYVHPSLLWNEDHARALEIDPMGEISKVMDQKPAFILAQKEKAWDEMIFSKYGNEYQLDTIIQNVKIYARQ